MAEFNVFGRIQNSEISKYTAHKNWSFTSQSFLNIGGKVLRGIYPDNTIIPISSSEAITEAQNWDGSYMKNIYYGINHLYYTRYSNFGYINYPLGSFNRTLNQDLLVFSVPRIKVGDKIKPSSLNLNYIGAYDETIPLADDGNYCLIDTRISTSSFVQSPILYLGFNDGFNLNKEIIYSEYNISYIPGISSSNYTHGQQVSFNGTGSAIIVDNPKTNWFNDFDNDFAISFWINITGKPADPDRATVISKKYYNGTLLNSYPFHINYNSSAQTIEFFRSDSISTIFLDAPVPSNTQNHIVFRKVGGVIEIYLNGSLQVSAIDTLINKVSNKSNIYIGCTSKTATITSDPFLGYLDEVRIFKRSLTVDEITSLSTISDDNYLALQTNKVGNVFYDQGIIVYSPYQNELLSGSFNAAGGSKDYTLSYRSSLDIEQYKYYINVPMDQYNVSTNPSLYDITGSLNSFATGSDFHPYITSVGLYDDKFQLVAIAKLGAPIPKRNDIDLNFEVRFDRS